MQILQSTPTAARGRSSRLWYTKTVYGICLPAWRAASGLAHTLAPTGELRCANRRCRHDRVLHRGSGWSHFFTEDQNEMTFQRDASGRITGALFGAGADALHARRITRSASRADSTD
jgi:hypothetical protein